jgi:hypothetical protein
VPVQNASSRRRLSAQAMYTWSGRVLGRGSGRVARRGWRPSAWCLRRRRGGRSRLGRESSLPQSGRRPGLWPGRGAAARAVVVCRRCTGRGPGRAAVAGGEGRRDRRFDDPHAVAGEHVVERARELAVTVADQESEAARAFTQIQEQVTGLLRAVQEPVG